MIKIERYNKKPSPKKEKTKETYPHFRRYKQKEGSTDKRVRHFKVIMNRVNDEFEFIGLTESSKRGHHKNILLKKNPEKNNKDPSYLRDELRKLPTRRFSEPLKGFSLSKEDKKTAWNIYHKNKKK